MNRDEMRLLLRMRAEALAPPAEIIDRALARCARIGLRQTAASGRQAATGSHTTPTYATSASAPPPAADPPAAGITQPDATNAGATQPDVPPLAQATALSGPGTGEATVPSLAQAPRSTGGGLIESGRIIAGYRIESLLGKGGMGAVYRATQLSMNRPVAFKVLAARFAGDPTFVGRFRREARAAGRLHHPNLVTVHDSGEADGLVFFSMELVEGRSLKDLLRERGRLPPEEALRVARQVLEALAYAHGKGVVHRDIKPDNVMVTAEGAVKVADLGLSRIDERQSGDTTELFQTSVGSFMGTPHYMAPEQGRDAHGADHRCDLYALGATLFHLVTGRQPFLGATAMEVLMAAQTQPLVWPEDPPPAAVRELIAKLMEKDPERRPDDAAAALRLVDRALAPPAVQPRAPRRLWPRVRGALLTAIGVAIAIAMLLAALHVVREREADRAWNAALAGAERDRDVKAFAKALAALRQVRDGMRDGSERAAACDEAIATISGDWDAWARPQVDAAERKFRELLAARSYTAARDRLRDIPDSWRSPETERRLEALQREWEDLVARNAEQQRDGAGSESAGLDEQMREGRKRIAAEMWRRSTFAQGSAVDQREGKAHFSGSGSGTMPLPTPGPMLPVPMRLVVRGAVAPGSSWELRLGPDLRLVVGAGGASLEGSRGSHPLPRLEDGVYGMLISQRQGGTVAQLGDRLSIPLPAAGTPCEVRWNLGQAEVTVALGLRR